MWKCKHCKESCINKKWCTRLAKRDCLILIILLVVALSYSLAGNKSAFDQFSFASTISSIILSVLAILLTLQSETKTETMKGQIEAAKASISEAEQDIKKYTNTLSKIGDLENTLEKVDLTVVDVKERAEEIYNLQKALMNREKNIVINVNENQKNNENIEYCLNDSKES